MQGETFITAQFSPAENSNKLIYIPDNHKPDRIELALTDILSGGSPLQYSGAILEACLPQIKIMKLESVENKKYLEADRIKRIQKEVTQALHLSAFKAHCSSKVSRLVGKRQAAQSKLDHITAKWDTALQDLEVEIESKKAQIFAQQQQELDNFDEGADRAISNLSFKPSSKTLEARTREHNLVLNENYLEAEKVKRKAEKLEAQHAKLMKLRATEEANCNRRNLVTRQSRQSRALEQWATERRDAIMKARDAELSAAEQRLENHDRVLRKIEQRGVTPNPNAGFTVNLVSRKDATRASRSISICLPKSRSLSQKASLRCRLSYL